MKHTLEKQAKRTGLALAVVAAFAAFGIGTAQAQSFASTKITLDNAGNLLCTFRETRLTPLTTVNYSCGATDVGVLTGCFVKNKFVGGTTLAVFKNVSNQEGEEGLLVKNNGAVNGRITTEIPESEAGENCAEPAEAQVVAVRWCNASLKDTTNNIVGATVAELFDQLANNADGTIPSCAELATMPPTPGGE